MRLVSSLFALSLVLQATANASASASTPAPARLLPADTLALLSVPDWDAARSSWKDCAYGKLWQDPALKSFREKLAQRWQDDFAAPLERELGIKCADYASLLHGQVTVAITQNEWGTRPGAAPGFVLLLDSKDKSDTLKTRLAELRKKWVDAGKPIKTDKIRDVEFTTLIITDQELHKTLQKAFPPPADEKDDKEPAAESETAKSTRKLEVIFGQSGSLLIVSNSARDIEKILVRQAGGLAPALSEQAAYESSRTVLFHDAVAYAWVNFATIYSTLNKRTEGADQPANADAPFTLRTDKVLAAAGLGELKTISARVSSNPDGSSAQVFLGIPESHRQGLFRLLTLTPKDAVPPAFVGGDVVKFKRWRIDGPKAWSTLESTLANISPELAGVIQFGFQAAGKERDPDFDLRKTLLASLGDDFISVQKPPKSSNLGDLTAPPSLYLVGSPNPEQLIQGMKAATTLMPLAGGPADLKEREFLGRKIYSLALPASPAADEKAAPDSRQFTFAATAGYAAMSTDVAAVEEFLRTTEASSRPLRSLPGLAEAAQKIGGMSTGFFGYENQAEAMRVWLESTKKESAALDKLLSLAPKAGGVISPEERKSLRDWMDASALPSFDRIAKYFHFLVYSLASSEEGLSWTFFAPTPPQLR